MADRPRGRRDFDPNRPRRPGSGRQGGDRPPWERSHGDRPPFDQRREFDRPRRDSDRPRREFDRPRREFDRPRGDRPGFDRPRGRDFDRPRRDADRPRRDADRPRRDADRPAGDTPADRSFDGPPERPYQRPRPQGVGRPYDRRGPGGPPARPPFRPAAGPRLPSPPRADLVDEGEEIVAGRRPVAEAFAARRPARRLIVVPERRAALESIVLHATTLRLPVVEVEGGTLTSLTGFDGHQGVALVVAARAPASVDDMLARARAREEEPFVLILDSLEDPANLGTLLRSAEACGVHGVIYPTRHAAPLTAAAVKSSAGASEHLLLASVDNLPGTLADLRAAGLRLVGADEGAGMRYSEADLRGPLALVVGSEERGISGALRRRLDMTVRIPMRGRVASLNAAVAGSVLLFAAAEQRGVPESGDRALAEQSFDLAEEEATAAAALDPGDDKPADDEPGNNEPAANEAPAEAGAEAELLPGGPEGLDRATDGGEAESTKQD